MGQGIKGQAETGGTLEEDQAHYLGFDGPSQESNSRPNSEERHEATSKGMLQRGMD